MTTTSADQSAAESWVLVYIINLIVPWPLGWMSCQSGGGFFGLHTAIFLIGLAGLWVCERSPRVGSALCWGGVLTALSQLLPLLQVLSGGMALSVWSQLAPGFGPFRTLQPASYHPLAELGALVVTFLTAYPLILLALGLGFAMRWLLGADRSEADAA